MTLAKDNTIATNCTYNLDISALIKLLCPNNNCRWTFDQSRTLLSSSGVGESHNNVSNVSSPKPLPRGKSSLSSSSSSEHELDAVLYVGVLLLVYALIIMFMIASNIRRQRMDAEEADYYEEFLQKRDRFKNESLYEETKKLTNNQLTTTINSNDRIVKDPIIRAPVISITEV